MRASSGRPAADREPVPDFDLKAMLDGYGGRPTAEDAAHLNPRFHDLLRLVGLDRRFVGGSGPRLVDEEGRRHLDAIGGYACHSVGRDHPVVVDALRQVLDLAPPPLVQFEFPPLAVALADRLKRFLDRSEDRVFFVNSGAEAVEAAMKIARASTGRPGFAHWSNAFHGLTLGALSLNGAEWLKRGFGPLVPGCHEVPFGDVGALRRTLADRSIAAFFYEPIQGKGVIEHGPGVLREVAEACRETGTLLVADEVQTGLGRTGDVLASRGDGVEPDLVCLSKTLSAGMVPVGAVVGRSEVFDRVFDSIERSVVHSSTFRENPDGGRARRPAGSSRRVSSTPGPRGTHRAGLERIRDRGTDPKRPGPGTRSGRTRSRGDGLRSPRPRDGRRRWSPGGLGADARGSPDPVQSTSKSSCVISGAPLVIGDAEADMIVDAFDATIRDLRRGGARRCEASRHAHPGPDVVLRESLR